MSIIRNKTKMHFTMLFALVLALTMALLCTAACGDTDTAVETASGTEESSSHLHEHTFPAEWQIAETEHFRECAAKDGYFERGAHEFSKHIKPSPPWMRTAWRNTYAISAGIR